jgi:hypothetical protein
MGQETNGWPLTAEDRVQIQNNPLEFVMDEVTKRQVDWVLTFSLISINPTMIYSYSFL